jgi:hypothetical protein
MTPPSNRVKPLPPWVILLGSALILLHFLAIGTLVLAASNGPWPTRFGESTGSGPFFAEKMNGLFSVYLQPLRLTHNYHYPSDHPLISAVYFEAQLKNANGVVFKTVRVPDNSANFWLRHRQSLLALGLGQDIPYQAPRSEAIPAPGKKATEVTYWEGEANSLKLVQKEEHLVPKDRPVFRPSEWSLLLGRSYQRYLSRHYDAAAVELIRHSKEPVLPAFMFGQGAPPGTFDEMLSSFGEYNRDKK